MPEIKKIKNNVLMRLNILLVVIQNRSVNKKSRDMYGTTFSG